jgi:hypothetical protein
MDMTGVKFIPGIYDTDKRTMELFLSVAHATHEAAAGLGRNTIGKLTSVFELLFHY